VKEFTVARLFGTDGVRGVAGVDLTADLARALASAAVAELAADQPKPLVVIGRDPRPSGPWLQDAVVDGLRVAGADVVVLGVIPTPAVARAIADGLPGLDRRPTFGVVISASHNPAPDNGIKLFGPGGLKLDNATEARIEARLTDQVPARDVGVLLDFSADADWYIDALVATVPHRLDGLKVVVDCANGAASTIAAQAYGRAGAEVTVINADLSGERINEACGATHLEALQVAVVAAGADAGIAHDGDADRCLAVAADGAEIDGDQILAALAVDLLARDALARNLLVVTVMSNLGLHRAMRSRGITVATTPVGDRHVAERMRAEGAVLGGEQSGHVVLLDHATTGDGVLSGLHLLAAGAASGRSLAELAAVMHRMPQVLINVRVSDPRVAISAVQPLIDDVVARLGDDGRVLVRPSGTEPLVRVMVEAETDEAARTEAERIAAAIGAGG
jgi:phosphoglucosamine mutase